MRGVAITLVFLSVSLPLRTLTAAGDDAKTEEKPPHKLVGTWKLVSAKYNGEEFQFPQNLTILKHVTPTQWMVVIYNQDGVVTRATGGHYTIKDDVYEETPEYGIGPALDLLKGKVQSFTWKVDGNKWFHNGKLSIERTVEEVWERDAPK
jgi:hypothetical protein